MTHYSSASRRQFLRQAGYFSAIASGAAPLALNLSALGTAAAQTAGDYRAIVCLFMYGGNDAFNIVLPTDANSWAAYSSTRTQAPDPIALLAPGTPGNPLAVAASPARLGGVLPILPARAQGRSYALHPLMVNMRALFDSHKRLAILPNVGPLLRPMAKADYSNANFPRPTRLFSHNDQQSTWQALGPEGANVGWGGRMAELLASQNGLSAFTSISASGNAVWLAGAAINQYQVSTTGAITFGVNTAGKLFGSADVGATLLRIASNPRSTHPLDADVAAVARSSISAEAHLRTALRSASDAAFGTAPASGNYNADDDPKLRYLNPVTGARVASTLAQQFQVVARLIDAGLRGTTQARRQIFFVSLGGFDTHDFQNRTQADLAARVDHALHYFDETLGNLNARNAVTTFTASDFGRTFTSNGDGTDHGWGSHHFVMGGAVRGGDLYGRFPVLAVKNTKDNNFDASPDQLGNGSLLPQTSVDQLGFTLGTWFGLSPTQLLDIFPNMSHFNNSDHNLGFMVT